VGLKKLEKKVKVLANIQDESDRNNIFSIGGSDSDTNDPVSIDPLSQNVQTRLHDSLARKVNNETETLFLASINQKESLEELLHSLKDRASFIARTPSIRPASGWISSSFGYREGPFSNVKEFHKGMDIAGREGSEILASADGVVKFSGKNGAFGNMVTVDHGFGMVTKYAHLKKILVNRGEYVKRGGAIGLMGNTGRSTGPHLHYEVVLNGINVNPLTYIQN
jgi:murein DD-endopeptidase MepM/ murein hydrolase activator NlpD